MRPWAKLWRRESPRFRALSYGARALGAYLLKFVDDTGRIPMGKRDALSTVAIAVGADAGDRRRLRVELAELLEHGYVQVDDGALTVTNYPRYQDYRAPVARRESNANSTRTEHELDANSTRVERELDARNDLTTEDHSVARSVLSEMEEEREENGEGREGETRASALATAPMERMLRSLTRPTQLEAEVTALVSETRQAAGGAPYRPQGHRDRSAVQSLAQWAADPDFGLAKLREALVAFWASRGSGASLSWLAEEEPGRYLGQVRTARTRGAAAVATHQEHAAIVAAAGGKGRGYAVVEI